uniref:Putative disease resistance RPP13-like protein 3 n=1 Tax=Aegilops tauschii TaxID=37682 RepID=R7WC47_AEGTA
MSVSATMGVMKPLLGKLAELAGNEYSRLKGVRKQASFLEKELSAMNAALEKMELMDELDPVARDWRDHVREMSYEIENCIDDFLRKFGGGHAKVGFIRKTALRLKMLGQRHRIADRMEELKVLALEANERRLRYNIDECNPNSSYECNHNSSFVAIDPRMSAIYIEAAGLVGTDGPRKELVSLLTDTEKKLKVVSIVGFGGLGKTTLAKRVYDEIREQFDCTAFVPVSQKPNMTEFMTGLLHRFPKPPKLEIDESSQAQARGMQDIIDDIIKRLKKKRGNPRIWSSRSDDGGIAVSFLSWEHRLWSSAGRQRQEVERLRLARSFSEDVKSCLTDRCYTVSCLVGRYLIVIDDLWDQSTWNTISRAFREEFPEDAKGSRVIVTTRVEGVAYGACYSRPECIYRMKPLGEQDSKRLFFRRVYGSEDDHPSRFEEISAEILKKCGGLPLAIITIASLLASRPQRIRDEWESIRNSLGTQFAVNPTLDGMRSILNLSYIHLPLQLRASFLHLGFYPADCEIERDDLVRQWLAEGLVNKLHGRDMEVVANNYFNELVNRSLIQPDRTKCGELVSCRVHDMMLDLILSKCEEHNFLRVECNSEDMAREHGWKYKVHRISMNFSGGGAADETASGTIPSSMSHVRSVAHFGGSTYMPPLLHFKYLRVILFKISGEKTTDLTAISQLFQLKYLKVSVTQRIKLPTEIQGLVHLETLDLYCYQLKIPSDIVRLPCLSNLIVPKGTKLPKGIRNMKSLRTLDGFGLRWSLLEDIEGLGELTNLKCLNLVEGDVDILTTSEVVALASSIGMLHDLIYLCIHGTFFDTGDHLSSLSGPFRHIKVLKLCGWVMPGVPKWICGLECLSWLELNIMTCTDEFHALGELPSLVHLSLWLDSIPEDSAVIFSTGLYPVLETFRCLSKYDVTACLAFEAGAMPKLRRLGLQFHKDQWGGATPVGLEHLLSLENISVDITCCSLEVEDKAASVLNESGNRIRGARRQGRKAQTDGSQVNPVTGFIRWRSPALPAYRVPGACARLGP